MPTLIQTSTRQGSGSLWVANFGNHMKDVVTDIKQDAEYRTSILSGSDSTPKTKKSKSKVEELKKNGTEGLGPVFQRLYIAPFPNDYTDVDTPSDNSCLFWSIALSILAPKIYNQQQFNVAYYSLFGGYTYSSNGISIETDTPVIAEKIRQFLTHYNPKYGIDENSRLAELVRCVFRKKIVDYMTEHFSEEEKDLSKELHNTWPEYAKAMEQLNAWGGGTEILAVSRMLEIHIDVHTGNRRQSYIGGTNEIIYIALGGGHYHYGLRDEIYNQMVANNNNVAADEDEIEIKLPESSQQLKF